MSNTISSSLFCFLIVSFCPHQIWAQDDLDSMVSDQNSLIGEELINKVCDHSIYQHLCLSSLQSVPESKNADLYDLTTISLQLAAANASEIRNHIVKLLNTSESDSYSRQGLNDCSENYHDAVDRIKDSLEALENKGYNDINSWVTAAMADAVSCEEGFHDHPDNKSPLTTQNTIFNQLCSNALTITNLLAVGI